MKQRGFTFIELLIAISLLAIFIPATVRALSFGLYTSHQGEKFTTAWSIARQGMEAIYSLKSEGGSNWDWVNTPQNTQGLFVYQPSEIGNIWQLGAMTTTPVQTQASFTRAVTIEPVKRCGIIPNRIICTDPLATDDVYTRKIKVYVTWPEQAQSQVVLLESYVTAH